jgi:predicted RNase H-like HicB family nuclease
LKDVVIIEQGENNYSAYVPDLPGCVSTGCTTDEVLANIQEAIAGHLEVLCEHGEPIPLPTTETAAVEIAEVI